MDKSSEIEELTKEKNAVKKILKDINAKYLEKIEELSLIRRVGDALSGITDFSLVCKSIVSIIQQELDPDNCSLMVVDEEQNTLVLRAAKGPYDSEARYIDDPENATTFQIGQTIAGLVARTGESILIQDVTADDRFVSREDTKVDIRSLLSLPLIVGDRAVAVLNLSHPVVGAFTSDKERILSIIANSSAAALENARLYLKLSRSRDRLARENVVLKKELTDKYTPDNIIGTSKRFADIIRTVQKVSGVDVNVLITGESGTGKELVARTIHYSSPRSEGPFVAVNCAALPDNLLESELFGIEKGVATGVEQRAGKFELAAGGTIFLDEVGDMHPSTQAKILRVLQEKEVQRIGGSKTIALNVRVISATNKDLQESIKSGAFREDLYFRLKVVEIALPSLRERRDDIPRLAQYFLKTACEKHGFGEKWFSREALNMLMTAPWRGNVRELQNVVEQAAILSSGEVIGPEDLAVTAAEDSTALSVSIPDTMLNYKETLQKLTEQAEKKLIGRALEITRNNKSEAAKLLGIGRRTLLYKLDKN